MWSFLWLIVYSDSPSQNRYISNIEKNFLIENTHQRSAQQFQTPWRSIFRSSSCWALFLIHTCHNWGTYTFLTSIPKYMDEVLGFDIKSVNEIENRFLFYRDKKLNF